jgi:predicted ATPase
MNEIPYLIEVSLREQNHLNKDTYPFDIPAVASLHNLSFHPDVTFIIGENGTGKSTIIEAIAIAMGFGPEGGTRNVRFATADTVSELHKHLRISKSYKKPKDYYFLRAESFYNVATYMDSTGYLGGYGNKSLHHRSHGESFMATLTMKLRGDGFYIFDEPEAALSPTRQMSAITAIHDLVQKGSQFIIATHSPILLAYPSSKIIQLDNKGLNEINYEDTEHYKVTRDFLNKYEQMVDILISNSDVTQH